MESGSISWVTRDIKFTAVCSNEGIVPQKTFCGELKIQLSEDVVESLREKLGPLLDKGRGSGGFIRIEIEIFQQLMVNTAALHAEQKTEQLYKPQSALTGKILSGIFDKRGNVAGHIRLCVNTFCEIY